MSERLAGVSRTDRLRLLALHGVTADLAALERVVASRRARQRELIARLHGVVPIAELVAATGMTRQHVHRLARRD
jgi:hypothetical protein